MRYGSVISAGLFLLPAIVSPSHGQDKLPTISARTFTGGSAKVTVTGAFSISQDIPINMAASVATDGMTWLQFGASGSAEPNAAITYNPGIGEVGIVVARGKLLATGGIMIGEKSECTGRAEVTKTLVSGRYVCPGLTSNDPATGKLGKVDVEIVFTAKT